MSGHTKRGRIRNKCIREKVKVAPIMKEIIKSHLK